MRHPPDMCPHVQSENIFQPEFLMGSSDKNPAIRNMVGSQFREHLSGRGIKGSGRLVHQPDRAFRDQKPGNGDASFLSCRKEPCRKIDGMTKPDPLERCLDILTRSQIFLPEQQIFTHAERRLECIVVGEIVAVLAKPALATTL